MGRPDEILPPPMGEGRGEGAKFPRNKHYPVKQRKQARTLRREMTPAEKNFWHEVKAKRFEDFKFRRQFAVGPYIVDFMCFRLKLVVEIDGGQHCENKQDEARTKFLEKEGFQVLRFWNNEVMENIEGVLHALSLTLSHRERELSQNPNNFSGETK